MKRTYNKPCVRSLSINSETLIAGSTISVNPDAPSVDNNNISNIRRGWSLNENNTWDE